MGDLRKKFEWDVRGADNTKWNVLVTVIRLPSGALETAVNHQDLDSKIKYILDNYDDNFWLKHNTQVRIVGYILL